MNWWTALLPAILASIGSMYFMSIRGHGMSTFRPEAGTVEVSVPRKRATAMRVLATCILLLFFFVVLTRGTWSELGAILALAVLCGGLSGTTFWFAAVMARTIVISAEGVQVIGFRGWQRRWEDLVSLEAFAPGMDILVFRFEGVSKLTVDGGFNGWRDLVKHLLTFTEDDDAAHAKVVVAIRELNRFRPPAERY
jgi:hypothetical protein